MVPLKGTLIAPLKGSLIVPLKEPLQYPLKEPLKEPAAWTVRQEWELSPALKGLESPLRVVAQMADSIGALIIGIGFRGPLFYNYNKEPPKTV